MTDHGYNNYYAQEQEQLQWQNYGISELDKTNEVLASNNLLIQRLQELTEQVSKLPQLIKMQEVSNRHKQIVDCELCNGDHPTGHCPPPDEVVNYMSNQRQWQYQGYDYYQRENNSNYGQGWRQNYGLSNSQYQFENYNQQPPQQNQTSKLEETLNKIMEMTIAQNEQMQQMHQENQQYHAALKNHENQVGQLAKQLANNNSQGGTFPTNTQINQHDQVIIISDEKDEEIIHNFEENEGGEDEKVVKPDLTKLPYPLSFAHEEHNEGDEESMVEKEEEGNQERVTENKAEIDRIIEEICALFEKKELRRIWTPQNIYLKFMEFLPNQRKKTDDVLSVSFWPP
ncbi:hypothetical protein QL285_076893 [Trifolium repens]|nr:hypothetical protein QL285_076893 [Trifolium repens]